MEIMRTAKTIFFFSLVFGFLSCAKTKSGEFWTKYQNTNLKINSSNTGLNGGYMAMHWHSDKYGVFNIIELISFANKNGWTIVDSCAIEANKMNNWFLNGEPIFPLSHTGFSSTPENISTYKHFPRWIKTDIRIYMFKTGVVMYEPGTDESCSVNGFIVLNSNNNEMSIYHLWGE